MHGVSNPFGAKTHNTYIQDKRWGGVFWARNVGAISCPQSHLLASLLSVGHFPKECHAWRYPFYFLKGRARFEWGLWASSNSIWFEIQAQDISPTQTVKRGPPLFRNKLFCHRLLTIISTCQLAPQSTSVHFYFGTLIVIRNPDCKELSLKPITFPRVRVRIFRVFAPP